jgi:hypothetical protein
MTKTVDEVAVTGGEIKAFGADADRFVPYWHAKALELRLSAVPEAAATGYVIRKEIMDFLQGIAPHPETGVWFGDGEEANKGRYWWRRILRDEIEQSTHQKETP